MAIGVAEGFRQGLESARQRRVQEEDRTLVLEDRARYHRAQDLAMEADQMTLGRMRRADAREPEELERQRERENLSLEGARFGLDRARTSATRDDSDYAMQQQRLKQQMQQEGVDELARGLRAGADPTLVLSRFNSRGAWKIDPRSFRYDHTTGGLEFVDSDGERFAGQLEQLEAAVGIQRQPVEPIKLGERDRLIDPRTYEELVPSAGDGSDADGNTGAGRNRRVSPYNPESAQGQITAGIVRSRGGSLDILGNWSIANPEDRQIVDRMVAMAHEMEGRLRPNVISGRLTPGQIVNAVTEATRDLPTESELVRRADQWRREPLFNRSNEQAAAWMATERARLRAEAEAKLWRAEQEILGSGAGDRDSPRSGHETAAAAPRRDRTSLPNGEPPSAPPPSSAPRPDPLATAARSESAMSPPAQPPSPQPLSFQEDADILSPWVHEAGGEVADAAISAGRAVATVARNARTPEPATPQVSMSARRVVAAMRGNSPPSRRDVEALRGLTDRDLAYYGFTPGDVARVRASLPGADGRPPMVEKPSWAGAALSSQQLGGARLDPGYEYDVELDGRRTTVRVAPDGNVYEVAGAPGAQSSSPTARPDAVSAEEVAELQRIGMTPAEIDQVRQLRTIESELDSARRAPTEFVY